LERSQGDLLALRRRHEEQVRATRQYRTEQLAELDAVLQHLTGLQALLQSPIGDLPSKTEADKLFRQAHALIIHGELDLAADRFGEFVGKYPDDERVVEATYRQGQVYFLARRYDHALVPSFAVVDGHPEHPRAVDARWVLARSLEEKGDFALARQFYAEMIDGNTKYQADAMRRVQFLNELQPLEENGGG
ncbi:MAG: tetratricopeptide repeat protein, partial [bacterium]